jgi:3-methyladenine DNA glycosylase AlkD
VTLLERSQPARKALRIHVNPAPTASSRTRRHHVTIAATGRLSRSFGYLVLATPATVMPSVCRPGPTSVCRPARQRGTGAWRTDDCWSPVPPAGMLVPMAGRPPSTALSRELLERLVRTYSASADPARAIPMRAYMRDQFPFLGIPAPRLAQLTRDVVAGLPAPVEDDLRAVAMACWALPEREYQYFACGWLRRHAGRCSAAFLSTVRHLIMTKSWWDTVDTLAAHVVGPMVTRRPELVSTMDEWASDADIWLARTALLHQIRYRDATDGERLFRYCEQLAGHQDFFIRKATGWALREYAKVAPDAVLAFVRAHNTALSPLSAREALRHL